MKTIVKCSPAKYAYSRAPYSMSVSFTPEQRVAIDTLDKSILVSAAAGSGKTAVLVERIINIILKGLANVDEMLVVTFTKAAASEMKLKLIKAIKVELSNEDDAKRRELLQAQLDMMYRSYISTFHAFALRVIKEFFYEIDIEPDFSVADDVQVQLMRDEIMEDLFDDLFEHDDLIGGSFREFLIRYGAERKEDLLMQAMQRSYDELRSMPNYFDWAYKKAEELKICGSDHTKSPLYEIMCSSVREKIDEALDTAEEVSSILSGIGLDRLADMIDQDADLIRGYAGMAKNDGINDYLFSAMAAPEWKRLTAKKEEKPDYELYKDDITTLRKKYKDIISGLKAEYADPTIAERFGEMAETYPYVKYYLDVLKAFEERFDAAKKDAYIMDYSDIEHYAARILVKPGIAETLKNRFKYIFIDEYQDTNYLQEYLIGSFARPNNLFKVGDVKQSIYGFRHSEPEIFERTAKEYSSPDNMDAVKIDLNRNFRSSGTVIGYINDTFRDVMPGYDENAMLYQGLSGGEDHELIPEVHVLKKIEKDERQGSDLADPDLADRTKREIEAEYVAGVVEDLIGTEYYDSKKNVVKRATMRDIVILMRSTKNKADIYYKALAERGIEAHISDEDGFFDTVEIGVALSLLKVIDNIKRDVPLIATLHSEIFGFDTDDLAEIRAWYIETGIENAARHEYSRAFYAYAGGGSDDKLRARVNSAIDRIENWREISHSMPLDDYVWHVLIDSNYYLYAGAMYGGVQRQANLRVLADKAGTYRESGITSLGDFIRYMDVLKDGSVKTGQAITVSEDEDVVRIMTIHKSKGLEFPFVIVAETGSVLKYPTNHKGFDIDPELGVGISYVNREKKYWRSTLIQRMINDKENNEDYLEELRVLYVAMTRAKEKLILVGTARNDKVLRSEISGRGSYLEIMRNVLDVPGNRFVVADGNEPKHMKHVNGIERFLSEKGDKDAGIDTETYAEITRRLGYEYPFIEQSKLKAKYSVSELRLEVLSRMEREYDEYDASSDAVEIKIKVPEISGEKVPGAAEIGTAYHRVMEYMDFVRAKEPGYIEICVNELAERGAIDPDVYPIIDTGVISAFFETDIGGRAIEAARKGILKREKPFTLEVDRDGVPVMVQGIIDCCWSDDGTDDPGYVLVDYKTSYMGKSISKEMMSSIKAEYEEQISLYRRAIEEGTGNPVRESYLYLFSAGKAIEM